MGFHMETSIGKVLGDRITVSGADATRLHNKGFYGEFENGILVLSTVEALYLLDRGKIRLVINSTELSFEDAVKYFSKFDRDLWVKYIIYSDLRRRGYVVKSGFGGLSFRVYERGASVGREAAKYLVFGALEGKSLSLSELYEMVRSARNSRKNLILAIVDRHDDVTYYDVTEVVL
ncbi:MAG: tRNA-intron lyase [Candidatus Methanomethylicota archaeon]|nr:MAG: tRNA-intron lyase [Candidatus Verstraetearchaeota archaeon]